MLIKYHIQFFFQRMFRGWDDHETWDFDVTFAKFVIPLIKSASNDPKNAKLFTSTETVMITAKILRAYEAIVSEHGLASVAVGQNDADLLEDWLSIYGIEDQVAKFICLRLPRFQELHRMDLEEEYAALWDDKVAQMIYGFQHIKENDNIRAQEGVSLFFKHLRNDLWW